MNGNVSFDLGQVVQSTGIRLQAMYNNTHNNSGLLFPCYGSKTHIGYKEDRRVCEQEARHTFLLELQRSIDMLSIPIHYHIETPTILAYSDFSKGSEPKVHIPHTLPQKAGRGGPSSGLIDASIYSHDLAFTFLCNNYVISRYGKGKEEVDTQIQSHYPSINIEFKFGTSSLLGFRKDLLKLYSENSAGMWFHMYEEKKQTCNSIKHSLKKAISEYVGPLIMKCRGNHPNELRHNILNLDKEIVVALVALQDPPLGTNLQLYVLNKYGELNPIPYVEV